MVCPKCSAVVADGSAVCDNCGTELTEKKKKSRKGLVPSLPKAEKDPKPEKSSAGKDSAASANRIRPVLIAVALVIFALICAYIYFLVNDAPGKKLADKLSDTLGRTITMAEKNIDMVFSEQSRYAYMTSIQPYNYIIESPKEIKVCGINLPDWAVLVTTDGEDKIQKVTYCDFTCLANDWKGQKLHQQLYTSNIEYGMEVKQVEKLLGFKPFYIVRTVDDVTTYCYKYFYVDPETGNDRAFYYWVDFNLDNQVSGIKTTEIDFVDFILSVKE